MSDSPATQTPAPTAEKPHDCRRKKIFCALFVLAILSVVAVTAFYFCPQFIQMRGDMMHPNAQYDARLAQMEARVQALESKVQTLNTASEPASAKEETAAMPAHTPADTARMQTDMAALSSAVNMMQADIKQINAAAAQSRETTQQMLATAITFVQLREVAMSGRGFLPELAAMRTAVGNDAAFQDIVSQLAPYAAQGIPRLSALREELITREGAATNSIERAQAQTWWQRVVAEMKGLVSVRPLHGGSQGDAFGSIEAALTKGDAEAALEAFKTLPPEAQQALADWDAKLEARVAANAALHAMAVRFTVGAPALTQEPQ